MLSDIISRLPKGKAAEINTVGKDLSNYIANISPNGEISAHKKVPMDSFLATDILPKIDPSSTPSYLYRGTLPLEYTDSVFFTPEGKPVVRTAPADSAISSYSDSFETAAPFASQHSVSNDIEGMSTPIMYSIPSKSKVPHFDLSNEEHPVFDEAKEKHGGMSETEVMVPNSALFRISKMRRDAFDEEDYPGEIYNSPFGMVENPSGVHHNLVELSPYHKDATGLIDKDHPDFQMHWDNLYNLVNKNLDQWSLGKEIKF